jgi:hypothetical protein
MIKARYILTVGVVFLSAALAVTYFQVKEPEVKETEVLTWDCELPEYKPKAITLTCADGGLYVDQVIWNTWTKEGATGSGIFHENLCDPSCAEGKTVVAEVIVKLGQLTPYKGEYYLRTLDIRTPTRQNFPWGRTGVLEWDVMEFAEMMNDVD